MQKRSSPRIIPSPAIGYFQVECSRNRTVDLRVPLPFRAYQLLDLARELMPAIKDPESGKFIVRLPQQEQLERTQLLTGCYIGQCWQHQEYDLQAAFTGDWRTYGYQVMVELFQAGFHLDDVNALMTACQQQVTALIQGPDDAEVDAEAEKLADFLSLPEAGQAS